MRRLAYLSLRVLSLLMLVGGIILFFIFHYNEWSAKIEHTSDAAMWGMLSFVAIGVAINSIPIFGLSFVVEAACRYIERCNAEDDEKLISSSED